MNITALIKAPPFVKKGFGIPLGSCAVSVSPFMENGKRDDDFISTFWVHVFTPTYHHTTLLVSVTPWASWTLLSVHRPPFRIIHHLSVSLTVSLVLFSVAFALGIISAAESRSSRWSPLDEQTELVKKPVAPLQVWKDPTRIHLSCWWRESEWEHRKGGPGTRAFLSLSVFISLEENN